MQHTSRLNYRIIQKGFKTINRNLYTLYFREIYPLIFWHIALIFNPQPFKAIWMLFHMCCFCCCCFCPPTSLLLCLEVFFPIFVEKLLGSRRWPLTWCFIYLENVTVWKFSICFFSLEYWGWEERSKQPTLNCRSLLFWSEPAVFQSESRYRDVCSQITFRPA